MNTYIKLLIFIFAFLSNYCLSDQWIDPEFDEMIDNSVAIVFGEITNGGTECAEVKIITAFKGDIDSKYIYVTGFSGRLGPTDTLIRGEQYYFFLRGKEDEKYIKVVQRKITDYDNDSLLSLKVNSTNLYFVWTPTSGDILYDNEGVHSDLVFNRSYKGYNDPISKSNFDSMLVNRIENRTNKKYSNKIFNKFKRSFDENKFPVTLQYLSILNLIRSDKYDEVILEAARDTFPLTRFVTARYLKNVGSNRSRDVLIEMMGDEDGLVQSEAVRSLKFDDPNIIGPLFLKKLDISNKDEFYLARDIMDPVVNKFGSSFMEILWAFAYMKYEPAIKYILPMLKTKDDYFYRDLVDILDSIKYGSIVPYYNDYLTKDSNSYSNLVKISSDISKKKYTDCKYPLMKLIAKIDKTKRSLNSDFRDSFLISSDEGLGALWDDEVKDFCIVQFKTLIDNPLPETNVQKDWITEFLILFSEYKVDDVKEDVYRMIFPDTISKSHEELLDLYHSIIEVYDSVEFYVKENLKYEDYFDSRILVKFLDNQFIVSYSCELNPLVFGFYSLSSNIKEKIPDSTISKFIKLTDDLGLDENEMNIYTLVGISIEIKESEINKYVKNDFLTNLLNYYIHNPDRENFLKMFYLFNEFSALSDGDLFGKFLKLGKEYYPN